MHLIYTDEFVQARLTERLAELGLATAPAWVPAGAARRRFGRRRRRSGDGSMT
jgi:hypothetical protein